MSVTISKLAMCLALCTAAALPLLQQATASAAPASAHAADSGPQTPCEQMKATTRSAVSKVIWPTSRDIALSGVPPSEFASSVNGRIAPTGTYETGLGALEYFYRLAGPLDAADNSSSRVVAADYRWILCEGGKRQVAFEVIFRVVSPQLTQAGDTGANYNISAMGIFAFDQDGHICSYDWDLRRLGLVVEYSSKGRVAAAGGEAKYNEGVVQGICKAAAALCTGKNQQYANQDDCEQFLRGLPVGDWDRADQNNLVCRSLHSLLVPLRPAVHCVHIGKTGGGKCVENPPNSLFTSDFSVCSDGKQQHGGS